MTPADRDLVAGDGDDPGAHGERLAGGDVTEVVRIGDTVRRTAGPWTPAVHALLGHLESVGFEGTPRPLGFDEQGREVLSFVEGDAALRPMSEAACGERALVDLARLLRRFHDAQEDFVVPADAAWRYWLGAPLTGEVVGHLDLFPPNVILRRGRIAALIDWDFAAPSSRLRDVASLVKHWVPLTDDARASAAGWPDHLARTRRLRLAADAYGLDDRGRRGLLDAVIENSGYGYESHRVWGTSGVVGFDRMWREGSGAQILADRSWLLSQWDDLAGALLA